MCCVEELYLQELENRFWGEYYSYPDPPPELESAYNLENFSKEVHKVMAKWDAGWSAHLNAIHFKYKTRLWMPSQFGNYRSPGGEYHG